MYLTSGSFSPERDSNINVFNYITEDMEIDFWGLAIGVIVILGVFGPWVTKGYDSYPAMDPETRQGELHFHKHILMSPMYTKLYEDGEWVNTLWFVSSGVSLAGVMLVSAAALSAIRYKKYWIKLSLFLTAVLGVVIFFMSFGTGLGIGLRTSFGWGLPVTLLGMTLMVAQSVNELTKKEAVSFSSS